MTGPEKLARAERFDAIEHSRRLAAREWPYDDPDYVGDLIRTGVGLAHKGHDGIPGAPEGVWCLRCEADRALDTLLARDRQLRELREAVEGPIMAYICRHWTPGVGGDFQAKRAYGFVRAALAASDPDSGDNEGKT